MSRTGGGGNKEPVVEDDGEDDGEGFATERERGAEVRARRHLPLLRVRGGARPVRPVRGRSLSGSPLSTALLLGLPRRPRRGPLCGEANERHIAAQAQRHLRTGDTGHALAECGESPLI